MCVCFFLFEIRDSTDYAPLRLARMTFVELRFFVVVVVSVDGDLKYFSIKNYPNFKSPNKRKQIQICDRMASREPFLFLFLFRCIGVVEMSRRVN